MALACDFRFAADNAKLGQPEILLGIIPGAGGTQRLPAAGRRWRKAKELIFSGRMVDMVEAPEIGLVDEVVPGRRPATTAPPRRRPSTPRVPTPCGWPSVRSTRASRARSTRACGSSSRLFAGAFASEDMRTGVASFIEHGPGKAEFSGR